jgi:hypothetical protein
MVLIEEAINFFLPVPFLHSNVPLTANHGFVCIPMTNAVE